HGNAIRSDLEYAFAEAGCGEGGSAVAEHDPSFREVVGRELDRDPVARRHAYVVPPHLARQMRRDDVAVVELHAEKGVREGVDDGALHFDRLFLRRIHDVEPVVAARQRGECRPGERTISTEQGDDLATPSAVLPRRGPQVPRVPREPRTATSISWRAAKSTSAFGGRPFRRFEAGSMSCLASCASSRPSQSSAALSTTDWYSCRRGGDMRRSIAGSGSSATAPADASSAGTSIRRKNVSVAALPYVEPSVANSTRNGAERPRRRPGSRSHVMSTLNGTCSSTASATLPTSRNGASLRPFAPTTTRS